MKKLIVMPWLVLVATTSVFAQEKASEQRLNEVVQRGKHVMPFDLEKTLHVFSKTPSGGFQQVVVKVADNTEQIEMIRQHLSKIANEFKNNNFSNPVKIHGDTMPGLAILSKAKQGQISIEYSALNNGAQIVYASDSTILIEAIHQFFDAQLRDHARHAISEHNMHKMHH